MTNTKKKKLLIEALKHYQKELEYFLLVCAGEDIMSASETLKSIKIVIRYLERSYKNE